jgi:ABC-type branched-subunit amino acid transport system substrate-binding protein
MTNRQRNADLGKRPLLDRRSALRLGLAGAATLAAPTVLRAETGELHVASLFDLTGNLNIYGIQEMNVSRYAIAEINKAGGVLGKKVVLHEYDTQSKIELYSRYAQEVGVPTTISRRSSAALPVPHAKLLDRFLAETKSSYSSRPSMKAASATSIVSCGH